jgi:NCAIR mutase (PurE)-related protein
VTAERDIFAALRAALAGARQGSIDNPGLCLDPEREARTGTPEIVLAEGKSMEQLEESVRAMLSQAGRVIVSRLEETQRRHLQAAFPDAVWRHNPGGRTAVFKTAEYRTPMTGGRVGILTAGASDFPAADEARLVAEEMGCAVRLYQDLGVAGLHRLVVPLRELLEWEADVLIVAAGMDGALPSVVSGLVPLPVIGLPTPVGYGVGGRGEAALLSMLQTCAPGLVVVNIDNGVGAGIAAARIASVAARARRDAQAAVRTDSRGDRVAGAG